LSRFINIALILGISMSVSCGRGKVSSKKTDPSAKITKRVTPAEFSEPQGFLDSIKHSSEPKGGFDPSKAPRWNTDRFMSFISDQGVVLTDVNDSSNRKVSPGQLRSELTSRKGEAFKTFAHLAHIYSIPYKQYSEVSYQKTDHGAVLNLSYGYKLTFTIEAGKYRLTQCDFTASEGG